MPADMRSAANARAGATTMLSSAAAATAGSAAGSSSPIPATAAAATAMAVTRRQHDAGQQLADRVDVVHHRAEDVAALQEPAQGQRAAAQRLPEPAPEPGQGGEHGVVQQQPLGVPQARPADAEEPHADDRGEQVQDGRLFAGPDDEPAGQPREGDGEQGRQGAYGSGGGEPARDRGQQATQLGRDRTGRAGCAGAGAGAD